MLIWVINLFVLFIAGNGRGFRIYIKKMVELKSKFPVLEKL